MNSSAPLSQMTGNRAATRGNPSFVWRAGQERRLKLILDAAPERLERVLVNGCGVGMYVRKLQPYASQIYAIDIEAEHLTVAAENSDGAHLQQARGESLPYGDDSFDLILSHEVLEHVQDDRVAVSEMVRTLRPGGRAVIFVPNRLYPFETHGHYWRGEYRFGNTPLINYLPARWRNRLAPHVRVYHTTDLLNLFIGHPVRVKAFTQIYPGYDNLIHRRPRFGRLIQKATYALEQTPLACFGISHFLVVEKAR